MLEFKNISINLKDGAQSVPFSLVVDKGDVVCLQGSGGSGKSDILRAILGLEPIKDGFITVDGELVTPGSSSYFRNMIAYIPQQLPKDKIKVSELFQSLFSLHSNRTPKFDLRNLLSEWQFMGLDKSLLDNTLNTLDNSILQSLLLSFLPSLNKEIVLLDNVEQTEMTQNIISRLVSSANTEVLYTCRENKMSCNKIVNL